MKISVVGMGYVGLSLSILISRKYPVVTVDVIEEKVKMVQEGISPIREADMEKLLASAELDLVATMDYSLCEGSDYIIIAVPTNYDPETNYFDTHIV